MNGFHAELLLNPLCWENGYIIPPRTPGLGVELNMNIVNKYPWDGDELHLQMGQKPYDPDRDGAFAGG